MSNPMTPKEALVLLSEEQVGFTIEKYEEAQKVLSALVDKFGQIPASITIEELKEKCRIFLNYKLVIIVSYENKNDVTIAYVNKYGEQETLIYIKNNKIESFDGFFIYPSEDSKFLYAMWLNETEIVTEKEKKQCNHINYFGS